MTLGYLEQIHFMDENKTVRDELKDAFHEIRETEIFIEQAERNLEKT
jgi:ATPase subunit of ABC transporter with duplicated ATPase domains